MSTSPRRVAMILADTFEDSEATDPIKALQDKGADVTVVGLKTGTLTGKHGAEVEAVTTVQDVTAGDYDLLVIPGGGSPEKLRIDEKAVAFTRDFVEGGKPVAAICHGPQLLISADVLKGRTVTCVAAVRDDVKNAGATYVDEECRVDGNLITSRTPDDLPAFDKAMFEALGL